MLSRKIIKGLSGTVHRGKLRERYTGVDRIRNGDHSRRQKGGQETELTSNLVKRECFDAGFVRRRMRGGHALTIEGL